MNLRKASSSSYAVVEFLSERAVEVVLSSWITGRDDKFFCTYPNTQNVRKLINEKSEPKADWKEFEVSVLRYKGKCPGFY